MSILILEIGSLDIFKGEKFRKFRGTFIEPFQFLAISLIVSESLLALWMYEVKDSTDFTEKIVVGSLSIAVLIAVLVVFAVVYWIKRKHDDFKDP